MGNQIVGLSQNESSTWLQLLDSSRETSSLINKLIELAVPTGQDNVTIGEFCTLAMMPE